MAYWYRYMNTCTILNAWDTTTHATNGADKDGDMYFLTDNKVLVENTLNLPCIMCVQRKAPKKIVEEKDLVLANKNSFGDDIGKTTNRVTTMFDVQARFAVGTEEHDILAYRIICGELYQQNKRLCSSVLKGAVLHSLNCWNALKLHTLQHSDETHRCDSGESRKKCVDGIRLNPKCL